MWFNKLFEKSNNQHITEESCNFNIITKYYLILRLNTLTHSTDL